MSPDLLLDAHAILGEGPVWHPRHHRLLWVDIEGHAVHDTDTSTRQDVVIPVGEQVGCIAPAGGRLLVMGLRSGFAALDLETRRRVHVIDPELHLPDNRFNDGKCDPAGRFWAGTMAVSEAPGRGSLYCLGSTLTVSCRAPGVSISNGLAWSRDAKTMYYVDSPERSVVAYDFDLASGAIERPRTVYEVPEGWGFPDGMTIDADGCLWVALWDGFRVVRVDPAIGQVIDQIEMPVARPTSCAFGGAALDELYITSASINLTDEQRAAQPHAGGVFVCRPGVTGTPTIEFGGAAALERLFGES
jgi:sugar lactone lactonase YvrE